MTTAALLCAAGAGVANALAGLASKSAQDRGCRASAFGLVAMAVACVMAGVAGTVGEAASSGAHMDE
jgi:hypothetical protein